MKNKTTDELKSWESLYAERVALHEGKRTICKIEDPVKRNQANATKRWRKKNYKHYKQKQKEWAQKNPDKIKEYQQRNKKNIKRWAEEHPDRIRELGRKSDKKRRGTAKRIAWKKEYSKRPEVIEKRREYDRIRNKTPERKAYDRERKRRKKEAQKALQTARISSIILAEKTG